MDTDKLHMFYWFMSSFSMNGKNNVKFPFTIHTLCSRLKCNRKRTKRVESAKFGSIWWFWDASSSGQFMACVSWNMSHMTVAFHGSLVPFTVAIYVPWLSDAEMCLSVHIIKFLSQIVRPKASIFRLFSRENSVYEVSLGHLEGSRIRVNSKCKIRLLGVCPTICVRHRLPTLLRVSECPARVFLYIQQAPCNRLQSALFHHKYLLRLQPTCYSVLRPVIYPFLILSLFPNLRFHVLSEFDDTKRSCRKRLAGHNERRRKSSSESNGEGSSHQRSTLQLNENQPGQAAGSGRTPITLPGDPTFKQFHVRWDFHAYSLLSFHSISCCACCTVYALSLLELCPNSLLYVVQTLGITNILYKCMWFQLYCTCPEVYESLLSCSILPYSSTSILFHEANIPKPN